MSDRPPEVDMVKDEPDILRGLRLLLSNVRVSASTGGPGYRRSRMGIASSVV